MKAYLKQRQILSWALYDWANSAYATVVMAGFFPIFFKNYWATGLETTESSFYLGAANSIASLIVVLLAPILGAIADQGSAKKCFLIFFALMGVVMSFSLALVGDGEWLLAILLYIAATLGFSGSVSFYDALMVDVAKGQSLDKVSAFGFAVGYLGGGILFAFCVILTLTPATFGLPDVASAVQLSFILVALWWALFTLPLLLWVKEPKRHENHSSFENIRLGFNQLAGTFQEIRKLKVLSIFLLAYWLYIDGVDTIVRMAVDYGLALGFHQNSLIVALLITQFVGFPAAFAFGLLGERYGCKAGIYLALIVYMAVCIYAYSMKDEWEFYLLAIAIGLVQGGIQALSRSLYARMIPAAKSAEFFGFYNMLGKFAAVIGPVMMGWVAVLTGSTRVSILSILLLLIAGAILLYFVDVKQGEKMAKNL